MPPGRHLIPSDFVTQNQRERMLLAMAELVAERGYQKTTIELIAKTSRVALVTFYEHFSSKEECFLAAFDESVAAAREVFAELLDPEQPWQEQISAGLEIFLEMVVKEQARAKLCIVEAQAAGTASLARYQGDAGERGAEAARGARLQPPLEPTAGRARGGDRRRDRLARPPAPGRGRRRRPDGAAAGDAAGDAHAVRRRGRGGRAADAAQARVAA